MDLKKYLSIMLLVLAAARILWPDAKIDGLTIFLVISAIILYLTPELPNLLKYIKKIKIGDVEIELAEQIHKLSQEVEEAQESLGKELRTTLPENVVNNVNEILRETSRDPRAAFLLLSARIEQQVRERIRKSGIEEGTRFMPVPQMIQSGIISGIFPKEVMSAFRDFWTVRNKVAHGEAFDVESSAIISLISLGTEILKMVSIEKEDK